MRYEIAYHTDKGRVKNINQDSICVKVAESSIGNVCMAVLCDGMGGLQAGERASMVGISTFSQWFDEELAFFLDEKERVFILEKRLGELALQVDAELKQYGTNKQIRLGTTITALLFVENEYISVQVGDSRAYEIKREMTQLTEDQSLVHELVLQGCITKEEAKHHSKRNILTQCLGGTKPVRPVTQHGTVKLNANYLLCSDGFVHEVDESEMQSQLCGWKNPEEAKRVLEELTERMKQSGERDNISSILINCRADSSPIINVFLFMVYAWKKVQQKKLKNKLVVKENVFVTDMNFQRDTTQTMEERK